MGRSRGLRAAPPGQVHHLLVPAEHHRACRAFEKRQDTPRYILGAERGRIRGGVRRRVSQGKVNGIQRDPASVYAARGARQSIRLGVCWRIGGPAALEGEHVCAGTGGRRAQGGPPGPAPSPRPWCCAARIEQGACSNEMHAAPAWLPRSCPPLGSRRGAGARLVLRCSLWASRPSGPGAAHIWLGCNLTNRRLAGGGPAAPRGVTLPGRRGSGQARKGWVRRSRGLAGHAAAATAAAAISLGELGSRTRPCSRRHECLTAAPLAHQELGAAPQTSGVHVYSLSP
jgi:hypothetical protein